MRKADLITFVALAVAVLMGACGGQEQIASRYVATIDVTPDDGGVLVVQPSADTNLGGTRLDVPSGAVTEILTVSVEPGEDLSFEEGEVAGGPAARFGPAGTQFALAATMTLPLYMGPTADEEIRIHAVDADGTRRVIEGEQVSVSSADGTASFPVEHFTAFQPSRRRRPTGCRSNSDCRTNETCQQGQCINTTSNTCTTDADCSAGDWCVQGACTTPAPGQCRTRADCATGTSTAAVCQGGRCVLPQTGCRSDADCPRGDWCVNASCVTPMAGQCRSNSDCSAGQMCVRGQCQMQPSNPCALQVSTATVSFGNVPVGQTVTRSITLRATQATSVSRFFIAPPSDYSVRSSAQPPLSVTPNRPASLTIDFSPRSTTFQQVLLRIQEAQAVCPAVQVVLFGQGTSSQRCRTNADCPPGQRCVQMMCM